MDKKITKSAFVVSLATSLSRILGYARDMFIARYFGAGLLTDAFFVGYRIPNLFRSLLGEGALSASFVPVFSEYVHQKSPAESKKLIEAVNIVLISIVSLITILGIIFTPFIICIIAPGFKNDPYKFALTVKMARIMFPFLAFVVLHALSMGILNTLAKFVVPAVAPCWFNLGIVFSIVFISPSLDMPVFALAFGVLIGGMLQWIFQIPFLYKAGFGFVFFKKFFKNVIESFKHPGVGRIVYLMMPAVLGLSIIQINSFVDTICATLLQEGSVSNLYYANRISQLPLSLFGTAFSTVVLSSMSKSYAQNNMDEFKNVLCSSIRMVFFLILPAMFGLMFLGEPIVKILFERGEFTSQSTQLTYWALIFYASGLLAYSGIKIFASGFYSFQDTKTPMKISIACMILNIILNLTVIFTPFLKKSFHIGGLALATSISSFVNLFLLVYFFRKKMGGFGGRKIMNSFIKALVSSILMAEACVFSIKFIPYNADILKLGGAITIGLFVYLASSYVLRSEEIKHIYDILEVKKKITEDGYPR